MKVAKLVEEYLKAQSLKILPQAPFGDAVTQFVDKDDKHAMEQFVSESLSSQVKQMLSLEENDEDLEGAMERIKQKFEQQFAAGQLKRGPRLIYKPKPDEWDSDLDGHWEEQPQAIIHTPAVQETSRPTKPPARGRKNIRTGFIDDEDEEMDDIAEEDEEEVPAPKTRGRPKATTTRAKAAPKAPAKRAPPKSRTAGRKEVENEEDEEEEEDVFMDDDRYDPPAPPPKRSATARATTTRSQPSRSQPSSCASASASASKTRQTKLNFSQKATQQEPLEISDDEISDDPFEPAPTSRAKRR